MGIVPDLLAQEWYFNREKRASITEVATVHSDGVLSPSQRGELDALISESSVAMKTTLGRTEMVELKIKTNSDPIKQRYYPLSRALQTEVNKEQMLKDDISVVVSDSYGT